MWVISSPLALAQRAATPFGWLDGLGLLLFGVGFFFEAVGDFQLARFRGDPANRGKVMDRGLWRYTRHPNYFGDATLWWGFGCFGMAAGGGVFALVGPALMTFLIRRISGVTLLEKGIHETRPGYREYIKRTSAFFPRPPRQAAR